MIKEGQTIEVQGAKYFVDYVEYYDFHSMGEKNVVKTLVLRGLR